MWLNVRFSKGSLNYFPLTHGGGYAAYLACVSFVGSEEEWIQSIARTFHTAILLCILQGFELDIITTFLYV